MSVHIASVVPNPATPWIGRTDASRRNVPPKRIVWNGREIPMPATIR